MQEFGGGGGGKLSRGNSNAKSRAVISELLYFLNAHLKFI